MDSTGLHTVEYLSVVHCTSFPSPSSSPHSSDLFSLPAPFHSQGAFHKLTAALHNNVNDQNQLCILFIFGNCKYQGLTTEVFRTIGSFRVKSTNILQISSSTISDFDKIFTECALMY